MHEPVIPAARYVPHTKIKRYPIDIRAYISMQGNAVIRNTIDEITGPMTVEQRNRFGSRKAGCFDFRMLKVTEYAGKLRYIPSDRVFDEWLYPDETLARGGGDCEDLAFLLASLLEESGISRHCIRVALGSLVDHTDPGKPKSWDHAWVVYQRENGGWQILEPLALMEKARRTPRSIRPPKSRRTFGIKDLHDIEYVPHFVFNRDHLWRVRTYQKRASLPFAAYLKKRDFWEGFDPSFAAKIHDDIFDHALTGMSPQDLRSVKEISFLIDTNVLAYDPRDHFDFAYIDAGWSRIRKRLGTGKFRDFALAAHAIGDFYAHSLYGYVAAVPGEPLPLYDPNQPLPAEKLTYNFGDFSLPGCALSMEKANSYWNGKLISGQWWRWFTTYPDDIQRNAELRPRRCLPDHDEVSVDGPNRKPGHRLFKSDEEHRMQYVLRRNAAIEHIQKVYADWKASTGT